MIRDDLVTQVSKKRNIPKEEAAKYVTAVLDSIKEAIENGEEVELRNFGCFRIREHGPRPGRNPKTKEEVIIPARKTVRFKPSKSLKIKN